MKIETDGNQIYDDAHPECSITVKPSGGRLCAFIRCLDWHPNNAKPFVKGYYGPFSWDDVEGSILCILEYGNDWK